MEKNLEKCDVVLLFCSLNALKSDGVKKEWRTANMIKKPIIPIFVILDHVPSLLRDIRGVEFDPFDFENNIENIYRLIIKKSQIVLDN